MEMYLAMKLRRTLLSAALCGAAALASSQAGELTVSWPSSGAAGYQVFIGEQAGVYARMIDVGPDLRATIDGLDDDRPYHFAVKGYDRQGRLAPSYSAELVCMARPRVTSVEASFDGSAATFTLRGANLDARARVRLSGPGVRMLEMVPGEPGALVVRARLVSSRETGAPSGTAARGWGHPTPDMFSVINPCRRSADFVEKHPEVADLDGNGQVDAMDLAAVRDAVGSRAGDAAFEAEADIDGDGVVDGEDIARVLARLRTPAR